MGLRKGLLMDTRIHESELPKFVLSAQIWAVQSRGESI